MKKIRSIITATATLILLSGCIERGHHLSVNQRVHRPTTTHNIGLHSGTKQAKKKLYRLKRAAKVAIKRTHKKRWDRRSKSKAVKQHKKVLISKRERKISHYKIDIPKKSSHKFVQKKGNSDKRKERKRDNKTYVQYSSPIHFHASNSAYHKYGTSEIHGHVIYLSSTNDEIMLPNTKIYLVPSSKVLDRWYKNYYLKNKDIGTHTVETKYLKKTDLDLSKNFSFFGVPVGEYYLIIESPAPDNTDKKIYMAKKIDVGKYKKVMAVFSKRL